MNIKQEQTIKATEVSMVMYCKAGCDMWKREVVVGVARLKSAEGASSDKMAMCDSVRRASIPTMGLMRT